MDVIVYAASGLEGGERALARRLLALALEREYGLREPPEIAREPGGKPFFPGHPALCFNLSHSRGAAVCALHDKPVGVDIEKLRPAPPAAGGWHGGRSFFPPLDSQGSYHQTARAGDCRAVAAVRAGPAVPVPGRAAERIYHYGLPVRERGGPGSMH